FCVHSTIGAGRNTRPCRFRHARRSNYHGLLLSITQKIEIFHVVQVNLVQTFTLIYIRLAVDEPLYLGFGDFFRRLLLPSLLPNSVPTYPYVTQTHYEHTPSHRFLPNPFDAL